MDSKSWQGVTLWSIPSKLLLQRLMMLWMKNPRLTGSYIKQHLAVLRESSGSSSLLSDDLAFLSSNHSNLQQKSDRLSMYATQTGLHIHIKKTQKASNMSLTLFLLIFQFLNISVSGFLFWKRECGSLAVMHRCLFLCDICSEFLLRTTGSVLPSQHSSDQL